MASAGVGLYWQYEQIEKLQTYGPRWLIYITDYHTLAQNIACLLKAAGCEYVYLYNPDSDQIIFARCTPMRLRQMQDEALDFMGQSDWQAVRAARATRVAQFGALRF